MITVERHVAHCTGDTDVVAQEIIYAVRLLVNLLEKACKESHIYSDGTIRYG
jgi:hypothetical protein